MTSQAPGPRPQALGKFTLFLLTWALGLGPMALSGCGYSLAGRGKFLPDYIRIVGIPQCLNQGSQIFEIDRVLTERLQREFASHGHYKTEPDGTNADALLTCAIKSSTLQATAFTTNNQASRYTVVITASI